MGLFGFGGGKRPPARPPMPAADSTPPASVAPVPSGDVRPTPQQALDMLRDGNAAFLGGQSSLGHVTAADLDELQGGQQPFAIIVGCADSRTPPTILFNQGLGRLFIIRVAGNTVDRRGLASIVYGVKNLGAPLVVVMGHTGCGAVAAAEAVYDGQATLDPSLEAIINPILPAVITARHGTAADKKVAAVEENARRVAAGILTAESSLARMVADGTLKVVPAVKDMASGRVRFLD